MSRLVRHDFSNGLISNELQWRSDLENYQRSLVQGSNFLPTPYGGVMRRPPLVSIGTIGSEIVDSVVFYPSDARCFEFIYSSTYRYLVIFTVFTDPDEVEDDFTRIIVQNTSGVEKANITVPYTQAEVLEIDVHQNNDTMWIAHNNHAPRRLLRLADDSWDIDVFKTKGGPFLDENRNGLQKMQSSAMEWNASISYLIDDNVLSPTTVTDDVTWMGGVVAAEQHATYASEISGHTFDKYWYHKQVRWEGGRLRVRFFPYLLIRVNNATPPATAVVDGIVKLNVDFTEDGEDASFDTTGTIVDVYDAGSVYYLLVDNGAKYEIKVRTDNGNIASFDSANLPDVEIPAAFTASYDQTVISDLGDEIYSQGTNYADLINIPESQHMHFLIFGIATGGGAEIDNSSNIAIGDSSYYYNAVAEGINHKPVGDITAFADAGGGQVTVTSAGHTIENGDSVTISGTTNYNGTFTAANVAANTFEITDTWVSDDGTGKWVNDTYWTEDAIANLTGSNIVRLESSGFDAFSSTDIVDQLIRLKYGEGINQTGSFTAADQTSDEFSGLGLITLTASGGFTGQVVLEAQLPDSNVWEIVGQIDSDGTDKEVSIVYNVESLDTLIRVRMDEYSGTACDWSIDIVDGAFTVLRIIETETVNSVVARVEYGINTFTTAVRYSLGAFGGDQGYPSCVTIDGDNRLVFSGTLGKPFRHFGSVIDDYDNFFAGTFDNSATVFESRSDASSRISWTEPKEDLFVGTDFGEYALVNASGAEPLSASNPPRVRRNTAEGSARLPARVVENAIAFISTDRKKLKLMRYDNIEQAGYRAYDMTFMNPTIAGTGFLGLVVQRTPFPVIWLWTGDGNAVALTLDRQHNVIGWSEHSTASGTIKSLCVIPDTNGIDEVYAVVQRNGSVYNATSNSAVPDLSGQYHVVPTDIVVSDGGSTAANKTYSYVNTVNGRPEYWNGPYKLRYTSGYWKVYYDGFPQVLYYKNPSDKTLPIASGWVVDTGGSLPIPSFDLQYDDETFMTIDGSDYNIQYDGANYQIMDDNDVAYFESSSLIGTYSPVGGSGATGSIVVTEANYHVEKLDYTETEYSDNLDGPTEQTITSIMEPTPLSRGPKFLEGNMKFRSARGFVYVVESNGGEVSTDDGMTWQDLDYSDLTADGNGLYTGMIEFRANSGYVDYSTIQVRTTDEYELKITALALEVEEHNRNGRG